MEALSKKACNSVDGMLVEGVRSPGFDTQHQTKLGMVAHVYSPRRQEDQS